MDFGHSPYNIGVNAIFNLIFVRLHTTRIVFDMQDAISYSDGVPHIIRRVVGIKYYILW